MCFIVDFYKFIGPFFYPHMMKRPSYPHVLNTLLFVVGMAISFGPVWGASEPPDSLLNMPIVKRFNMIADLYHKTVTADSSKGMRLAEELIRFFDEKGTEQDKLLVRVSLLPENKDLPGLRSVFLDQTLPLIRRAERHGNSFLIAKIHQNIATFYYNTLHEYGPAFRHYLRMYELIKDMDAESFPDRNYAVYLLSRAYYDFFDYENAIRIGKVLKNVKPGSVENAHVFNACVLGMSYLELKRFAEARQELEWALGQLPVRPLNDTTWAGILNGNIGISFFEEGRFEEAIPFLQTGLNQCTKTKLWSNAPRFSAKLARISLSQQQPQRAYELAELTLNMARRIRDPTQPRGLHMAEPYQLMFDCSRALGLYEQAILYADSATAAKEQWRIARDVAQKHKAEISLEMERHEERQSLLAKEKEQQILIRNGLMAILLLGGIIAALLYNRQNLQNRHRQQQLVAEKQRAVVDLEQAMAQLEQLQKSYRERSDLIAKVEKEWPLQAEDTPDDPARQETLDALHQSVLLTEDAWVAFTDLLEKVHPGFLHRLRIQLPDLSPAETRFLTLQKLGYTHQEMAAMLGVGLGAIRQYRLRIRRKFGVSDDTEIEQLVAVI